MRSLAILADRVVPIEGEPFPKGGVLVEDGVIVRVGPEASLRIPRAADVERHKGTLVPGLIDAHSHAGLHPLGVSGDDSNDYNEWVEPVTAHLRALDAFNPDDEGVKTARKGGLTTLCALPGSANVIAGLGVTAKTLGVSVEDMAYPRSPGLKIALGENPRRIYRALKKTPTTRMGVAAVLRERLVAAQSYLEERKRPAKNRPRKDLGLEVIGLALQRKLRVRCHCHRADDILTALRVQREFGLDMVLDHCTEGWRVAREIARAGVPAVVGPDLSAATKQELAQRSAANARVLVEHGVRVALMTDHPVFPNAFFPFVFIVAAREGLPREAALRAVTLDAARILGIDDRAGSLAPGKDADLTLFGGDPFDAMSPVVKVWVRGEVAHG